MIAPCTSPAAESTVRDLSNCSVICVKPLPLLLVIWMMPGIWPNCRSSGVATEDAVVLASAPGSCAETWIVGKSTFGNAATGRFR